MLISKAIIFLILQHQPKNDFQSCGQAGNVHPLLPGMRRSAIYRTNGIGRDTQRQRDVAVRGVGRFVRLTACEGANDLFTFCRELTEFFLVNRAVAGTDAQQLRALIRQARKDARDPRPGEALRQGRAYRQIFALLREQLSSSAGSPS